MVTSGISNNIVFADKGGIPNFHAGDNPTKHFTDTSTSNSPHCPIGALLNNRHIGHINFL
jgi:hypothetical protein